MKYILLALALMTVSIPLHAADVSQNPPQLIEPSAGDLDLDNPMNCVSEQHSEWLRCKVDADCAIADNACNHPQFAAAAEFKNMVERCAKIKASATMDCAKNDRLNGSVSYTPDCHNGYCRAVPSR